MTSLCHNDTWLCIRVILLLVAMHGPQERDSFVQCSEEGYVQRLPQIEAMKEDMVADCSELCACYPKRQRDNPKSYELHVDCSQRGLSDFPADIPKHAYTLDMSGNKVINMTSLPRLTNLRELNLANNWLRYIDNKWVFEHSSSLRVLRLSENRLRSIKHGSFSGLQQLEELDLSMNILTSLDTHALAGLHSLQVLRLDRNQLYDFSRDWFMSLTSLIELHASHNHISVLESHVLDRLKHLQHVDLSENALRLIHREALVGLTNLKLLNLSSNTQLTTLSSRVFATSFVPRLDILLTDDTNIQKLSSYAVSNMSITELSLSFMPRLRVVEKFAFYNCSRLHTLQIHDNPQLIFIHPLSFSSLPSLQHLLIHNNGLIVVPGEIITSLPSLVDLQLHHNPLHCDCNSYWLRKELEKDKNHYTFHKHVADNDNNNNQTTPSSSKIADGTSTSIPVMSNRIVWKHGSAVTERSIIREPDRVSCFFPSTQQGHPSSESMLQLPLHYFSSTCLPSTLPLFPPIVNATLGDDLKLECHGLGVPTPQISWLLPTGIELNSSTVNSDKMPARMELTEEALLTIKNVHMSDAGIYGCTASNSLGQDMTSVMVHVQNKPLDLSEISVGYNYVKVALVGNVPRVEIQNFQIYYRNSNPADDTIQGVKLDSKGGYRVIHLRTHGSFHRLMINGLKPHTAYQVCLVYKNTHLVSCKTWTTLNVLRVVRTSQGIVRVSKTQVIVAIVGSVAAVIFLMVIVTLVRRRSKTSGYHDSVGSRDEKASIPLDGMLSNTNTQSLNSSRTALLSNSHV